VIQGGLILGCMLAARQAQSRLPLVHVQVPQNSLALLLYVGLTGKVSYHVYTGHTFIDANIEKNL
jgi:hypothetical protein